MKFRSVYILFAFAGLFLFSCQKQDFTPVADNTTVPEWYDDASNTRMIDNSESTTSTENPDESNGGITDPNSDPDGDRPSKTRIN